MSSKDRNPDYVTEEEAARLWSRAAQLQAEAARRAERAARRDALQDLGADEAPDPAAGYSLVHVRSAAVEAGIGEEYVDAALADLRAQRALDAGSWSRLARRFLGNTADAVVVSRVIHATPSRVLEAMEEVLPAEPYSLALKDRPGDPAAGDPLVFDIPSASIMGASQPGFTGQASYADLREVHVTLRPVGERACELTVRSPVAWAYGINAGIGAAVTGVGGGVGMGVGSAAAAVIGGMLASGGLATLAAVLASVAVVGGVVLGGAGGLWFFRKLYRHALGRGERGLEGMLAAVAMRAEGGWGFAPKALPEGEHRDG